MQRAKRVVHVHIVHVPACDIYAAEADKCAVCEDGVKDGVSNTNTHDVGAAMRARALYKMPNIGHCCHRHSHLLTVSWLQ